MDASHSRLDIPKLTDTARHRFLMCSPEQFGIFYAINPWMEGNVERAQREQAHHQWENFHNILAQFADIESLAPQKEMPDLVFTAGGALVYGKKAVVSRFRHDERRKEEPIFREWLKANDFEVLELPEKLRFEGAADALFDRSRRRLFFGYGNRSDLQVAGFLAEQLDVEVVPLHLIDERFHHLHTCFLPLTGGFFLYYPDAFDDRTLHLLERKISPRRRLAITERDALQFACNAVDTGNNIIMNACSPALEETLIKWGFNVHVTPLGEFIRAGGAASSLTLRLDEPELPETQAEREGLVSRSVHFRGHLIQRGVLSDMSEIVHREGGDFAVRHFAPGARAEDHSELTVDISAPDEAMLDEIISMLLPLGGQSHEPEQHPARIVKVTQDGVAPDAFYSTTIFPTFAFIDGQWLRSQNQRMDVALRVDRSQGHPEVYCTLIRDLRVGDEVIVGTNGIRVDVPRQNEAAGEDFKFMSSEVSSERRVETTVDRIAHEILAIKERKGRIVVVAGPVVVHTGGSPYLAKLIREGYIDALLGGNAIAVHDMENCLYGTSLGVDLKRGVVVGGGHQHHIRTINTIRGAGGIAAAVEKGIISHGVMFELVKANVPYCLAGSIRDDGPLLETMMDLVEAQSEYARLLGGADMVLMLSSMLHSIGTGNMTPSGVRMVCVDINPAVATKLADRGSLDSMPVVTDVGLFLNLLSRRIEELR